MSTVFKFFLLGIVSILLGLYYLLGTTSGNQHLHHFASHTLSQKSGLNVVVSSIDLAQYPEVVIEMHIERKAKITLTGILTLLSLDMDYTLISDCIATDICEIDDNIHIEGNVHGAYSRMAIQGKGEALDGNVTYHFLKFTDKVEDLTLLMRGVNSTKLFTLMGYDELFKGKADIDVNFKFMEKDNRQGSFIYDVKESKISGLPFHLHAQVEIDGDQHTFHSTISSPFLKLDIKDGHYNQNKKLAKANYSLDIQNLSHLEPLLGYKYLGPFSATGEMLYNTHLIITGHSESFKGMLDYFFEKDGLYVDLDDVSYKKFMEIFPFPSMLSANVRGNLYYNFIEKTLILNANLYQAKVIHQTLVKTIRRKSTVNLKKETFTQSRMDASYHDGFLVGELNLNNKKGHLHLNRLAIDFDESSIDTYFDVKLQDQEFAGKIYGSLEEPKVNLQLQKLIKYQMSKQINNLMGEDANKMMSQLPMEGMAKGLAAGATASFIKVCF